MASNPNGRRRTSAQDEGGAQHNGSKRAQRPRASRASESEQLTTVLSELISEVTMMRERAARAEAKAKLLESETAAVEREQTLLVGELTRQIAQPRPSS